MFNRSCQNTKLSRHFFLPLNDHPNQLNIPLNTILSTLDFVKGTNLALLRSPSEVRPGLSSARFPTHTQNTSFFLSASSGHALRVSRWWQHGFTHKYEIWAHSRVDSRSTPIHRADCAIVSIIPQHADDVPGYVCDGARPSFFQFVLVMKVELRFTQFRGGCAQQGGAMGGAVGRG